MKTILRTTLCYCVVLLAAGGCHLIQDDQFLYTFSDNDRDFLRNAAYLCLGEIEMGKAAEEMASLKDVRDFAARMHRENTIAWAALDSLAQSERVQLPDSPDQARQAMLQYLKTLNGIEFDTVYLNSRVIDHQKGILLFSNAQLKSEGEGIRLFIARYLPRLQEHLDTVTKLRTSIREGL